MHPSRNLNFIKPESTRNKERCSMRWLNSTEQDAKTQGNECCKTIQLRERRPDSCYTSSENGWVANRNILANFLFLDL